MGVVGEGAGAAVWEDCARGGVDRFTPKLFTNMCPTFRGCPIFWVGVRKACLITEVGRGGGAAEGVCGLQGWGWEGRGRRVGGLSPVSII